MKPYAMGGILSSHGSEKMLARKPEEERPLRGPGFDGRILLKYMYLRETEWEDTY
jgi:hypothetical protein